MGGGEIIPELSAEQLYDRIFGPLISEYGKLELITQNIIEDKFSDLKTAIEAVQTGTDGILADMATATLQGTLKTAVDTSKGVLDNIKAKTDNLDVASSTLATSLGMTAVKDATDLVKGVLDNVKTGTDKIIASGATEAKQDSMINRLANLVSVSDNLLASSDAEATHTGDTVYTKVKEFLIQIAGHYRVYFEHKYSVDSNRAYGRVYKNGVAYGALITTVPPHTDWVETTEDLYFDVDDLCQLYVYIATSSETATARYFRLYGDTSFVGAIEKDV